VLAVLAAWLVLLGLNGLGPLDLRSHAAERDLRAALTRYARSPVVHEKGVFSHDGHRYEVDATIDRSGDSQGTVVADGRKVEVRYAGGHPYAMAGQDFWAPQGALAGFLAGKWVTSSEALAELTTAALTRSLSLLDVARPGVTFDRRGQPVRLGGEMAVPLTDRHGTLYVTAAEPQRFVRLVSDPGYRTADGITDVRVDLDYPESLSVKAPSPVVDLEDSSTLPAQYVLEEGSIQHGGDCNAGSTCTVVGSVTNQRGPQVGGVTADVHLVKDDGSDLGACTATIRPIGHRQHETFSCAVSGSAWLAFTRVGGRYRAEVTVHNPLYDG
jgi:hypothetical protein